jgi:predicted RNA methylase
MLKMAGVGPDDTVYDLGCGDGRIIFTAALNYGAKAVGIEIDPIRYIWVMILNFMLRLGGKVKILFGDFFKYNLSNATVVMCYLLPSTNTKLEQKLLNELKPGTRVVSNSFTFPNLRLVDQNEKLKIYMYEI